MILPQNDFGGVTVTIDAACSLVDVNLWDFFHCVVVEETPQYYVSDGDLGVFNLTDGLQANELQQVYAWNISKTPEDPFVL